MFLCLKFDEVRDPAPFKNRYYFFFFKDFFQMTKEGVCPKESKQKDHSQRTTGKYARRRQKFYIYS